MSNRRLPVLCNSELCTGCSACVSACSSQAISMLPDTEGFLRPVIDTEKCVMCLACENSCPVLNIDASEISHDVYACWNKDAEVRKQSSSGGAFSALAEAVINEGGVVFGAAYDEQLRVSYKSIEKIEDIPLLRSSKYVQSDIGNAYKEVKHHLEQGRQVLFVGTPCYVNGLHAFLKKDYDRLVCCDFVCHGVPSPLLWSKYLEWLTQKIGFRPVGFNFRDKRKGWKDSIRVFLQENGKEYVITGNLDSYCICFYKSVCLRESCYRCQALLHRTSDITIGDFWGIGLRIPFPKTEVPMGISLLDVHTSKGAVLGNKAQMYLEKIQRTYSEAVLYNSPISVAAKRPSYRDMFYKDLERTAFDSVVNKYCNIGRKQSVVNFIRQYMPAWFMIYIRNLMQK